MKFTLCIILLLSLSYAQAQTKTDNKKDTNTQTNDHDTHHTDHSHHDEKNEKSIKSGKKFVPTPELKVRMEKILTQMRELEAKSSDKKLVIAAGSKLTAVVNDIIKTCKLDPNADAAVHPTLGLILAGSADFKKGDFTNGHEKIHEALMKYQRQFAHEGWKH